MKEQLTLKIVSDYLNDNFAQSNAYPEKVIRLQLGSYMLPKQAATLISFELVKSFEFTSIEMESFLIKAFSNMNKLSKEQASELYSRFPSWPYFDDYFRHATSEKAVSFAAKAVINDYFNRFSYERKYSHVFYTRLQHWAKETGRSLTIKRKGLVRFIFVSA